MTHSRHGTKGFFDRVYGWIFGNFVGRHHALLQIKIEASVGMAGFNKSVKSHWSGAYSFYRVRPDEIGFTGSYAMYKTVKEAIEKSGLRYKLRYFGTRISKGERDTDARPKAD